MRRIIGILLVLLANHAWATGYEPLVISGTSVQMVVLNGTSVSNIVTGNQIELV